MIDYRVLGVSRVSGTSKTTGQAYSGVNVYACYADGRTDGLACDRVYISDRVLNGQDIRVEDNIHIFYNRFGRVDGVEVCHGSF